MGAECGSDAAGVRSVEKGSATNKVDQRKYHAKAAAWDHSAAKINKTPLKTIEKQVAFKVSNVFVLAAWFVRAPVGTG